MTGIKRLSLALTTALTVLSQCASLAQATQPNAQQGDVFSRTTTAPPGASQQTQRRPAVMGPPWVMQPVTVNSTPVKWMEAFDDAVGHYSPTLDDALILKKPMNQEVERVMEWSRVTAKIARNYRVLAKTLRAMPNPMKLPDAVVYKDNMADWYDDQALLMEDLIRQRKPARYKEELDAALAEIHERAEGLKQVSRTLKMMDSKLRASNNIHPPIHSDALMRYVTRDPNK